jgi:hypothetical protein
MKRPTESDFEINATGGGVEGDLQADKKPLLLQSAC